MALPIWSIVSFTAFFCSSVSFASAARSCSEADAPAQSWLLTEATTLSTSLFVEGSAVLKLASSFTVSTCSFLAHPTATQNTNALRIETNVFITTYSPFSLLLTQLATARSSIRSGPQRLRFPSLQIRFFLFNFDTLLIRESGLRDAGGQRRKTALDMAVAQHARGLSQVASQIDLSQFGRDRFADQP